MEWWIRVVSPVRWVWIRVADRIRRRKSGLVQLRREVRTCEYEDVHVMWEMLRKNDAESGHVTRIRKRRKQHVWIVIDSLCRAL